VPAEAFFTGFLTTLLAPDELLTEVRFPPCSTRSGTSWEEFSPRRGDFALAGAAIVVAVDQSDTVVSAAIVLAGVDEKPLRVPAAEQAVLGRRGEVDGIREAGERAAEAVQSSDDLFASAEYKRRLVRTLVARGLRRAHGRATGSGR
jgi:CO/xanthine dehydrogenase FAD-binding subunit